LTPTHAVVADPAVGRRTLPLDEFYKCWTGVLLLLKETPDLRHAARQESPLSRIRSPAFLGLRTHLLTQISQRIDADVVMGYHLHLLGLPLSFFSSRPARDIVAQLRHHSSQVRAATSTAALSVIVDALSAIMIAPVLLYMNWRVTVIPIAILAAVVAGGALLNRAMQHHRLLSMQNSLRLETEFADTIDGLQTIKSLNAEAPARTRIEAQVDAVRASAFTAEAIATLSAVLSALASGICSLVLMWAGGNLVLSGSMTVGQLMGLNTLLGLLLGPLERLVSVNATVQDGLVAAGRLSDALDVDVESARQSPSFLDRTVRGTIDFEDVTFAYGSRLACAAKSHMSRRASCSFRVRSQTTSASRGQPPAPPKLIAPRKWPG
jgi:ATP-binding cassette subfamily B protein